MLPPQSRLSQLWQPSGRTEASREYPVPLRVWWLQLRSNGANTPDGGNGDEPQGERILARLVPGGWRRSHDHRRLGHGIPQGLLLWAVRVRADLCVSRAGCAPPARSLLPISGTSPTSRGMDVVADSS